MFKHFLTSVNESNAFILACDETRDAILIDAGAFEPAITAFVEAKHLKLKSVFITHDHYDHTGGLREIVDRYDAQVYAGSANPGGCRADTVGHGDAIRVGGLEGRVLATPGHTPDALSLTFPGMVFTGDALFAGSVGGTASPALARQQSEAIKAHI
ncbi:MAG TPA: MBL fold metallo-hydrolase, partial [Candidatus Hydrogenedentes bacterium]|nr:MBL fold metallo-hydrolase [Candidatus Hydrogenedentota bacterium]